MLIYKHHVISNVKQQLPCNCYDIHTAIMSADTMHVKRCLLPQIDMHLIKADVVPARTEWSNHIVEHVFTNDHISLLREASELE